MHIHQFIDFGMLPYCCSAWAADAKLRHAPHAAAGCAFSTDPRPVDEKTLEEQNFNARYVAGLKRRAQGQDTPTGGASGARGGN